MEPRAKLAHDPNPESNRDMKELGEYLNMTKMASLSRSCSDNALFLSFKVAGEPLALDVPQNLDHYSENWVTGT
jgi:hypothetical protein